MNFMNELVNQNGFFQNCEVDFAVATNDDGEVDVVAALLTEFKSNEFKELLFTEMTTFADDVRHGLSAELANKDDEILDEMLAKASSFADLEKCAEEYGDALYPHLAIKLQGDKIEILVFEEDASFMPDEWKHSAELGCKCRESKEYNLEGCSCCTSKEYKLELTDNEVQKLCKAVANEVFDAVQDDKELSIETDEDTTAEEVYNFIKSCGFTAEQDVQKLNDKELE